MNSLLSACTADARANLSALIDAPLARAEVRERWKYSSVTQVLELVANGTAPADTGVAGTDQTGVSFTTGVVPSAALLEALAHQADACPPAASALRRALTVDRLVIHGAPAAAVRILHIQADRPLCIELAPGARVVIEDVADDSDTGWIQIEAGAGSQLDFSRLRGPRAGSDWQLLGFRLQRDTALRLQNYSTGASRRRLDARVELAGAGASLDLAGCWLARGQDRVDQQWHVEHRAPHTSSTQVHHGLGDDGATTTFRGRIFIGADCPHVSADLVNHNLALAPGVTCNTKPELEIHNHDVRCSHGATVGQLPEESVFYLRSRGFDPETARRLLAAGFIRRCIRGSLGEAAARVLTAGRNDGRSDD